MVFASVRIRIKIATIRLFSTAETTKDTTKTTNPVFLVFLDLALPLLASRLHIRFVLLLEEFAFFVEGVAFGAYARELGGCVGLVGGVDLFLKKDTHKYIWLAIFEHYHGESTKPTYYNIIVLKFTVREAS